MIWLLAALLKSPFDLTDEHLIDLAPGRPGSLWQALLERGSKDALWRSLADRLLRWQGDGAAACALEFYAGVLDRDGMRARMLARLGSEAADPLDEFFEPGAGLRGASARRRSRAFSSHMGQARVPRSNRDMEQGRDEVRVMTVHGAKGLEAPIVFLPDTRSTRSGRWPGSLPRRGRRWARGGMLPPFLWPVRGTRCGGRRRCGAPGGTGRQTRMSLIASCTWPLTRARDRLYIAGFEGTREAPADWLVPPGPPGSRGPRCRNADGRKRAAFGGSKAPATAAPQAMAQLLSPSAGTVQAPA